MSQETPPMWPCRTQAAPRTARAPQEQPPPCLSCRNLPAPAPQSWTLPETSLQAACLHLGDPTPHPGVAPAPELRPPHQAAHHDHPCRQDPGSTRQEPHHGTDCAALGTPAQAALRGGRDMFCWFFLIINQVFLVPSACMALLGPLPAVGRGGRMHL